VRAFAAEAFELLRFDRAADAAMRVAAYRVRLRASSIIGMQTAFYMAIAAVLWVGGGRVASNRMSIGDLTEILAFMTILQQPVRQIIMIINSAARATSSGQRLFEILDRAPEIRDRLGAEPLVSRRGVLRFESVDFAYPGSTELVLKNISFDITPGKTLGIVGAPGSGKSTLAHLIPRFYDVTAGRITLDSRDIRDLTLDSLRGAVALVAQETFLFDIAASANIAYAWPDADEAAIAAAAATAHIHDHLASLSHGYMTPVGERGVTLSGGQRQRLSIARGVLADPVVLIFDDSLSAVDTGTEAALRAKLAGVARKCATIIIAHRLSGIRHADEIIVLANGRIVERGGHASLLARNGHYAALHRLQASQTEDQSLRKARA
jgi:ATP-binding cassette subfamily B protein